MILIIALTILEVILLKWVKRSQPLSDDEINKLGVKLPDDFIQWYKQYEDPEGDNIRVNFNSEFFDCGLEDVAEFYPPHYIVDEMDSFFGEEEEEYRTYGLVVPFAYTSVLNKYCFFYPKGRNKPFGVFFAPRDYDLSEVFEGNDINNSLYISRTFQGFLDKLYIDEDWI